MRKQQVDKMRRGFFTYAWDLVEPGARRTMGMGRMREDYHCNAVLVSANYHHARVLRPRAEGRKTVRYTEALAAFQPQAEKYPLSSMVPAVEPKMAGINVLDRARTASQEMSLDFGLWVVGLHNSTLGEKKPDLCVQNAFGDVYSYSLCPSQPVNRDYIFALAGDLCSQFSPDRLVLEAVGSLGLRHGNHHELFLTSWDSVLELLFSLCFCPACTEQAADRGVDVDRLQQEVQRLAHVFLEEERGVLPVSFREQEVVSLLMETEGLWDYLQSGRSAVTELVGEVGRILRKEGVQLEVIPASFHRPASTAWLEKASLSDLSGRCDGLLIPAYFEDAARLKADLSWVKNLVPGMNLIAGINALHPTPSAGELQAQVKACQEVGCGGLYYYNYGLLTEKRLAWVKEANQMLNAVERSGAADDCQ